MADRRTKGGHLSGDTPVSELTVPDVLFKPGAGATQAADSSEPADAPPYVPTLRCPLCGHPDTSMRACKGGYSLSHGMCFADAKSHFHRRCPRCTHDWITYDTLDAAADGEG